MLHDINIYFDSLTTSTHDTAIVFLFRLLAYLKFFFTFNNQNYEVTDLED